MAAWGPIRTACPRCLGEAPQPILRQGRCCLSLGPSPGRRSSTAVAGLQCTRPPGRASWQWGPWGLPQVPGAQLPPPYPQPQGGGSLVPPLTASASPSPGPVGGPCPSWLLTGAFPEPQPALSSSSVPPGPLCCRGQAELPAPPRCWPSAVLPGVPGLHSAGKRPGRLRLDTPSCSLLRPRPAQPGHSVPLCCQRPSPCLPSLPGCSLTEGPEPLLLALLVTAHQSALSDRVVSVS